MAYLWPGQGGPRIDYISDPPMVADLSDRPRKIVILGSTGSIGASAFDIALGRQDSLEIIGLAAGGNVSLLASQASCAQPKYLAVRTHELANDLKRLLPRNYRPEILWGQAGYAAIASLAEADCVLSAQGGSAGLAATAHAANAGKIIALANKESLVLGGKLIRRLCRDSGASILPVDSEHYAIFQCLSGQGQTPRKLILTASGGPFRGLDRETIRNKRSREALRHPNWNMGKKITIDSATLMNKGLEYIEAMELYGVGPNNVEILIHPQSIVHSLVEFSDNSMLAQLARPEMRLPIAACLFWPQKDRPYVPKLDLARAGALTFHKPDLEVFACLKLALEIIRRKPSAAWELCGINPAYVILNAANEQAVELFLNDQCLFGDIACFVEQALQYFLPLAEAASPPAEASLDEKILQIQEWSEKVKIFVKNLAASAR